MCQPCNSPDDAAHEVYPVISTKQLVVARFEGERDSRKVVVIYERKFSCLHTNTYAVMEIRSVF